MARGDAAPKAAAAAAAAAAPAGAAAAGPAGPPVAGKGAGKGVPAAGAPPEGQNPILLDAGRNGSHTGWGLGLTVLSALTYSGFSDGSWSDPDGQLLMAPASHGSSGPDHNFGLKSLLISYWACVKFHPMMAVGDPLFTSLHLPLSITRSIRVHSRTSF